mgnify:CR=1 FL=1
MKNSVDKKRLTVLNYSLKLENISSTSLAFILDIENGEIKNSKSLGNKSSSLSFNQKVNLLLDNKSINKSEKFKLESFMAIRNQFMHNLGIESYKDVFDNIHGLQTKIIKLYPEVFSNEDLEKNLETSVERLFFDGIQILTQFKGGKKKKLEQKTKGKVYEQKHKQLLIGINKAFEFLKLDLESSDVNLSNKEEIELYINHLKSQILIEHNK